MGGKRKMRTVVSESLGGGCFLEENVAGTSLFCI
jgi:hypothetical protein